MIHFRPHLDCDLWQFDDGAKAVRCSQDDMSDIECNCYMLCYQAG